MQETSRSAAEPTLRTPAENENATPGAQHADDAAEDRKNILYGLLWCVGGLLFSFLSYYFTTAGSRYYVATGAILWGFIQACKGVAGYLKDKYRNGQFAAFWRAAAITVCAAVLIGYLFHLSYRVIGNEVPIVDREQTYLCHQAGVRMTIPAGFTALETTWDEETETTYATGQASTWNDRVGVSVECVPGFIPGEVASIGELTGYCQSRDSLFYDAEILVPAHRVEIGGREMLASEGRVSDSPDQIYSVFDLKNRETLVTVSFNYPASEHGKEATRELIDDLLGRLVLSSPATR